MIVESANRIPPLQDAGMLEQDGNAHNDQNNTACQFRLGFIFFTETVADFGVLIAAVLNSTRVLNIKKYE